MEVIDLVSDSENNEDQKYHKFSHDSSCEVIDPSTHDDSCYPSSDELSILWKR